MIKAVFIVGPTASGKTDLSISLAKEFGGEIICADSMQIYKDLSVISARPTPTDEKIVPHFLYGYTDAYTQGSVHHWIDKVIPLLKEVKNPILVGGTGLYISVLVHGMNDIPEIPTEIRNFVRQMDITEIKARMKDYPFQDPQRLCRALEVLLATGKPLTYFQNLPKKKLIDAHFQIIFINPDRKILYRRCEQRFHQMIEQGGIQEVQNLLSLNPTGGVLKAIGVPEIISYLKQEITQEEMFNKAILSTRHYAKRQVTWFKHQIKSDIILSDIKNFDLKSITL